MNLARRAWVPETCEARVQDIAAQVAKEGAAALLDRLESLAGKNRDIHERECFNLNPATNVMNPRA